MEQYMGFRPKAPQSQPERELPQVNIYGTMFLIDIARHEFRQVDNPDNRITMGDVPEEMGFTHFLYDTETKNRFAGILVKGEPVPDHVRIILVPPMKDLDPDGLAIKQGLPSWKEVHKPQAVTDLAVLEHKQSAHKRRMKH